MNDNYSARKVFFHLLKQSQKYILWYFLLCLSGIMVSFLEVARTEAFRRMINAITKTDYYLLKEGFLLALFVILSLPILKFISNYGGTILDCYSTKNLQTKVFRKITNLKVKDLHRYHSGDLIARMSDCTASAQRGMNLAFLEFIENAFKIIFILLYLTSLHHKLTLVCIIITVIFPALTNLFTPYLRKVYGSVVQLNAEMKAYIQEVIQGGEVVRSYSLADNLFCHYQLMQQKLISLASKQLLFVLMMIRSKFFVTMTGMLFIFGYGGMLALEGNVDVGSIVVFSVLFLRISPPAEKLIRIWPNLQQSIANANRIFEIMEIEEELNQPVTEIDFKEKELLFSNVSFGYDEKKVLDDISLEFKPGEVTVLVGESGAGKSTILNLVLRIYQPDQGEIFFGGESIQNISLTYWRTKVSYLSQVPFLFTGTIYENIAYGKMDATDEEIYAAAKAANIHDFITSLPEGYQKQVGEGLDRLSSGQKQRIAIARAFLKNSDLIILDEPFSSLDNENKEMVYAALQKLIEDKMVIAVSHDFQFIKKANKIYLVENGKIEKLEVEDVEQSLKGVDSYAI